MFHFTWKARLSQPHVYAEAILRHSFPRDSARAMHPTVGAQIVEFMAEKGSRITRCQIKSMGLPRESTIAGIVRAGEGILVNGDTQVLQGDKVVVFCKSQEIRKLERFFKE